MENTSLGSEHCRDEQEERGQGVHVVGVSEDITMRLDSTFIRKFSATLAETFQRVLLLRRCQKGDTAQ
jgi:hypothetical protein